MLICSDKEGERYVVIGFERVEKQLTMKWKITGLCIPRGIAANGEFIYVADSENNRIIKFNIRNRKSVCESPGFPNLTNPRGIIAKNEWLFVCNHDKNQIEILDEDLNFHFSIKTIKDKTLSSPNDIACIYDIRQKSYTLYVTTNVSTIVVLKVYLHDQPRVVGKKIISACTMGIKLNANINMRSICIVEEKYIFVTEMEFGGRIICLNLKEGGICVKPLTMKSSATQCPTMIAHCGNTITYCEIHKGKHAGCDMLYFDLPI